MPKPTLLKPISPKRQRGRKWHVYVNGVHVPEVSFISIDHPKLGTLSYGETPAGYDGWAFHEEGGGGAVTLPFSFVGGALWVGLVHQRRHNQGGDVWNAPRGFLDPGERHADAAARELAEETGFAVDAGRVLGLPGAKGNPNSAFFETWGEGEGIGFFALEVSPDDLTPDGEGFTFRAERVAAAQHSGGSAAAEMIWRARFFPWAEAAGVGDLLTNAAVARLLAWLKQQGRPTR